MTDQITVPRATWDAMREANVQWIDAYAKLRMERDSLKKEAELGNIAMRFVDRAGDVADCDPAERICSEFHEAMSDAVDRLYVQPRSALTAANAVSVEPQAQGEAARLWCETCEGGGTVDNTLGGDNINATSHDKCPDCDGHGYFVSSIYRDQPQTSKLAWLPIETAPEDGYMLVYEDEAIRALFRYKGKWQKIGYPAIVCTPYGDALVGEDAKRILPSGCTLAIKDGCCENPTHWMPLPAAPEAKQ